MTDDDSGPPSDETPMQKALRLKKAALAAKGAPSGRARDGGSSTGTRTNCANFATKR